MLHTANLEAGIGDECTPEVVLYLGNTLFDYAADLITTSAYKSEALCILDDDLSIVYDLALDQKCADQLRASARSHRLFSYCQEDPYTNRSFTKPTGYARDAKLLDFLYSGVAPSGTSELGRDIFEHKTRSQIASSVLFRRDFVRACIDETLARNDEAEILALNSGHCRELELSLLAPRMNEGQLTYVSEDAEACTVMLEHKIKVEARNISPLEYLASPSCGQFDLIYVFDLLDQIDDGAAMEAVDKFYGHLAENGKLFITNFSQDCVERGYMDFFMDWRVRHRKAASLQMIFGANRDCSIFQDPSKTFEY